MTYDEKLDQIYEMLLTVNGKLTHLEDAVAGYGNIVRILAEATVQKERKRIHDLEEAAMTDKEGF